MALIAGSRVGGHELCMIPICATCAPVKGFDKAGVLQT